MNMKGSLNRFELLREQENSLFMYNELLFNALKLRKHDYIDYTLYDFSSMSIDIPNAPIRPKTPLVNKHGRVIKVKNDREDEVDPKTVAIIGDKMPDFDYIPTIHEFIMMYTKALKIEQSQRKKSMKNVKAKQKSGQVTL